MHLIITDPWLAKKHSLHLSGAQLLLGAVIAVTAIIGIALATYHALFIHGARQGWPVITPLVNMIASKERRGQEKYLKENLDAMARKMGEMQARLVQLESLGARVSSLAGLPLQTAKPRNGAGGLLVSPESLSMVGVSDALDALDATSMHQFDHLSDVESRLFSDWLSKSMLPTSAPVPGVTTGSDFGWRVDPLTGQKAMHTGLDFPTDIGTPILAAAGGMVVASEFHVQYGNMLEIDHGNDLITRYAHASRLLVNRGDIVKRGQLVGEVGNTGRSTGPHLHFEVWHAGNLKNPQVFLSAAEKTVAPIKLGKAQGNLHTR